MQLRAPVAAGTFPLSVSANARYLQGANGTPFPILGRSYWGIIGLSRANAIVALDDAVSKSFNAIEFRAPNNTYHDNFRPFDGANNLPFTTKVGGGAYSGDASENPDFTTPNEAYWVFLDTFMADAEARGLALLWFPAYVGFISDYTTGSQGWMQHMVDNGSTRMTTYGAYVGNRYKNQKNLIWMIGGDKGDNTNPFVGAQITVEQAFMTGLNSVSGKLSTQFAAEWDTETHGSSETNFAAQLTTESCYSFTGATAAMCAAGYAASPTKPTFLIEEPYDEEGSDGTSVNANATQPTWRFVFRAIFSGATAGYMAGNGYLIHFFSGYASHFSSQGQLALAAFNTWIRTIAWQTLAPFDALLTSGGGTIDTDAYVARTKNAAGTLAVIYAGISFTSFVVDRTQMSAAFTVTRIDPSNGTQTAVGGSHPNTTTETFNDPGNNAAGYGDWFYVLST